MTEALRRNKTGSQADEAIERARRQLFTPAWPVIADSEKHNTPVPGTDGVSWETASALPATCASGSISFSSRWKERLAAGADAHPGLTEQFRRLAATLHHAQQANNLRSVMVTSASPREGKTLTAINLALVLAESYRYSVLLVDADLRRPSIPNVMDIGVGSGLSETLVSQTDRKLALVPITSRLSLLPAGHAIANSIEALTSPRMKQILDEASSRFDWVILDAPPIGPATDARLLSQMVGGTLFVIHAGQSQCPDVERAISAIGREHILGVVLNAVEHVPASDYYYGTAPGDVKG
jgi:capsular exopolysaccharide synthesis family protein